MKRSQLETILQDNHYLLHNILETMTIKEINRILIKYCRTLSCCGESSREKYWECPLYKTDSCRVSP
jgi:hypothetical protein